MNIIFMVAFFLALLMLGLIILGIEFTPKMEKAFKIVVLIILAFLTFNGTGWYHSL
jgi:hypothetical protein